MRRKILVLDVETKPAIAYVWRAYDENIGPDQIIDNGGIICYAGKFIGEKHVQFDADWEHPNTPQGRKDFLTGLWELLREADAVITYNGDRFDLTKIQGEFALSRLPPMVPPTSIDVLKTVKKLGLFMNRLAFVGPLFEVGAKVKHEGFNLWKAVMNGDPKAQAKMRKYNIQDIVVLERLYLRLRPFIKNHPHLGDDAHECGACGSNHVQKRGFRRTKFFKVQRIQCQDCGAWSEGAREKIK